ncbi:hypothetical protein OGAPHI_005026 [Ogataea philodendri]|uniref:MIF4G domain-containing protein n=1 Tax=Ogataea philodendri TaxID=1378263 RepID=A0A9P8P1X3_9ASCO|nr:uncharacterized protein OGAPHI_005026 [Ogataea philodendri]KAH3663625.1 hypothetical protein OGAPHI_005026 [Ogataea philodendri]
MSVSKGVWSNFTKRSPSLALRNKALRTALLSPNLPYGPASLKSNANRRKYKSIEGLEDIYPLAYEVLEKKSEAVYNKIEKLDPKSSNYAEEKERLLVEAEKHNPEVVYMAEYMKNSFDRTQPVFRHYIKTDWLNHSQMLLMQRLETLGVIPDTLPTLEPEVDVKLKFPHNNQDRWIEPGVVLSSNVTKKPPALEVIEFKESKDEMYTVLMVDPDTPDLAADSYSTTLLWGVKDVKLSNTDSMIDAKKLVQNPDLEFVEYQPPVCEKNTGKHRIAFWVFRQDGELANAPKGLKRDYFKIRQFVEDNKLTPVGAHVIRSVWDRNTDAVRQIMAKMHGKINYFSPVHLMVSQCELRRQLFSSNQQAWDGVYMDVRNVDTSLKANTSLLKKLSTSFSSSAEKSLLKAVSEVSLTKYMDELIPAVVQGLSSKGTDPLTAVKVCSVLHQRFGSDFTRNLVTFFISSLSETNEKGDSFSALGRLLVLFTEFYLVGLIRLDETVSKKDLPRYLSKSDTPLLLAFMTQIFSVHGEDEHLAEVLAGYLVRFGEILTNDTGLLPDTERTRLVKLFSKYSVHVINWTTDTNSKWTELINGVGKYASSRSLVPEPLKIDLKECTVKFKRLYYYSELAQGIFDIDGPDVIGIDSLGAYPFDESVVPWESEEDRQFYLNVPLVEELIQVAKIEETEVTPELLEKVSQATSAADVDSVACSFWNQHMNSPASLARLLEYALLPQSNHKAFARFLKLNRQALSSLVLRTIRKTFIDFKIQILSGKVNAPTVTLFCQLVNFNIFPPAKVYEELSFLLCDATSKSSLDTLHFVFDQSGATLRSQSVYHELVDNVFGLLQSLKSQLPAGSAAVDEFLAAYPDAVAFRQAYRVGQETDKKQKYLDFVLRLALDNISCLKHITKNIYWDDEDYAKICTFLTSPGDISYDQISALVRILKELGERDPSIVTVVVDDLIEQIQAGLEEEDVRENRKLLAVAKYLAELSNMKLVPVKMIQQLIVYCILESHSSDQKSWFWVHLVCQFLDSVTKSLTSEYLLLDYYLALNEPPSVDLQLRVSRCFQSRGRERAQSLAEAASRLKENRVSRAGTPQPDTEASETEEESDEEEDLSTQISEDESELDNSESDDAADAELYEQMMNEHIEQSIQAEFDALLGESLKSSGAKPKSNALESIGSLATMTEPQPAESNKFTFLAKAGRKLHSRVVTVPEESGFASRRLQNVKLSQQEHERVKDLILERQEYSALATGIVYGAYHTYVLKAEGEKKQELYDYEHKKKLVEEAKAEYKKLHPVKQTAAPTEAVNLDDPEFDFGKFILGAVEKLGS